MKDFEMQEIFFLVTCSLFIYIRLSNHNESLLELE